jgi:hypothetical protein
MLAWISKYFSKPINLPILSSIQIEEIKKNHGISYIDHNLSEFFSISDFSEYLSRRYTYTKDGILKGAYKESIKKTIEETSPPMMYSNPVGYQPHKYKNNQLIEISNQKNPDINGLYLIINIGSDNENWILQKIVIS